MSNKFRKKGFTLIELLVVISIIALLLSILMPSLQRAKELAKGVVCGNNLHQLGIAMYTYAADYDDNLPPCSNGSVYSPFVMYHTGLQRAFGLAHLYVNDYTKVQQLYYCPSMKNKYYQFNTDPENRWWEFHPGTNNVMTKSSYYYWTRGGFSGTINDSYKKTSEVSKKAICSDNFYNPSQYAHETRKGFNVLYGDSSVRFWKDNEGYFKDLAVIWAARSWPDLTRGEISEIFRLFDQNN